MSNAAPAGMAPLVQAAKQRRLVIYAGAGVSRAEPAGGPTGPAVADRLRPYIEQLVGAQPSELVSLNLEALTALVEQQAPDRMPELRARAAEAFDFRGIEPNFGHGALALLLREGLAQLVTVNWDCGVERAGMRAEVEIEGVATAADCIRLVQRLPLYKVHGCATKPESLALTQNEVDRPQTWAVAQVQSAVTGGVVIFVGLGTVGMYVREPIEELADVWTQGATTVRVVDPALSDAWREALGELVAEAHVAAGADEFLDDLLRSVIADALANVDQAARVLAENEEWAEGMIEGFMSLRDALAQTSADSILRWWRDGVIVTEAGKPFITELSGRRALMTIALLVGLADGSAEARGVRGRLTVGSPSHYFEIVSRPGEHVSRVELYVRDRVARRREEDVYPDGRPIIVVVCDATGVFPAFNAPPDIGAGDEGATDVAVGVDAAPIRLVAAEDGVLGRLTL